MHVTEVLLQTWGSPGIYIFGSPLDRNLDIYAVGIKWWWIQDYMAQLQIFCVCQTLNRRFCWRWTVVTLPIGKVHLVNFFVCGEAALAWTHRSFRFAYVICVCGPAVQTPSGWWAGGNSFCSWWIKSAGKLPVAVTLENLQGSTELRCVGCWQLGPFWNLTLSSFALSSFVEEITFDCKGSSGTIEEVSLSVFPSQKGPDWALWWSNRIVFWKHLSLLISFVSVSLQDLSLYRSCLHPVSSLEGRRVTSWQCSFLKEFINAQHPEAFFNLTI